VTETLTFSDSTARFRQITDLVTLNDIATVTTGTITSVGIIQTLNPSIRTFCTAFSPVVNEEGIADTTVVENTYMYYVLPPFCDD